MHHISHQKDSNLTKPLSQAMQAAVARVIKSQADYAERAKQPEPEQPKRPELSAEDAAILRRLDKQADAQRKQNLETKPHKHKDKPADLYTGQDIPDYMKNLLAARGPKIKFKDTKQ